VTTSYRAEPGAGGPGPVDPVRLRVREPADLIATIPFLLGFHPANSLVALFLRSGRVVLSARFDLPDPSTAPAAGAWADLLVVPVDDLVRQHEVTGLVLAAYCADVERAAAVLREHQLHQTGVELLDLLLVDGERWWSLACTTGCCPPEGSPYAPGEHPLSAEAVWAGLVAQPDRAAVVARVAGPPPASWAALDDLAVGVEARLPAGAPVARQGALGSAVVAALAALDGPSGSGGQADGPTAAPPDDDTCLALALLVREAVVRDVACALVSRADAARHVALWQEVVAHVPPYLALGPLGVLGVAAWADGNGTLLNACCERLEALDPGYPMGRLLSDVSRRALPPSWWDAMADGLREDLGLVP
jgi:hypothetical protein